jgi:hypothetical protein
MFVSHHQAAVQNYNRPIKYLINPWNVTKF